MATRGLCLFGTLFALLALVAADTIFITPPQPGNTVDFTQNPTYELGDEIDIKWKSAAKDVSIQVWRAYPPMSRLERPVAILGNTQSNKQPWTVDVTWPMDFDKTKPAVYYFSLYESGSTRPDANSHYFNVTTAVATAPSATGGDAAAGAGLELRSEKGQDESATDEEPYVAPPLSKAGKIGLAVVCIVGGGIVIGCYAFVTYWTIRHNRERVYYEEEDEEAAELNEDEEAGAEYQDEQDDLDYLEKSEKDETIARKRALPRGDDDEIRQIA